MTQYRLNRHMYGISLAEDAICRICKEQEEPPVHVLCYDEDLAREKFLVLGVENLTEHSYIWKQLS